MGIIPQSEVFHSPKKTKRRKPIYLAFRKRLIFVVWAAWNGVAIELHNDTEVVLYRIALAKGGPQLLPFIQQAAHGRKFMSNITARVHAIRNAGFRIFNRTERMGDGSRLSWYWIGLSSDGSPALDDVEYLDKTGRPKTTPASAPAQGPEAGTAQNLFPVAEPHAHLPRWSDPDAAQHQNGGRG